MKKISINIGGSSYREQHGIDKVLELCKKSGFDAIDFNLECYKLEDTIYGGSEDAFCSHFHSIAKKAKELELEIYQTHGRCRTCTPDPTQTAYFFEVCEKDFKAASILGSSCCVVHPVSNAQWGNLPKEEMRSISQKMFDTITPFADKHRMRIALETCGAAIVDGNRTLAFFGNSVEFKRQFEKIPTNYKTICLDSGHVHEVGSFGVPPVEEVIRMLGKDISVLHLHDNCGTHDDHQLPGLGKICWPNVFDALDEIGYDGTYNIEVSPYLYGGLYAEFMEFAGKYIRRFVDGRGVV